MTNRTCDAMRESIEDLVFGTAVVEGITCGADDARNIIRGEYVDGISQHDIDVIGGLVDAYGLMFECCANPVSFDAAARYNWCVEHRFDDRAGKLRADPVYISGCEYEPPMPSVEMFDDIINTAYDVCDFSDD